MDPGDDPWHIGCEEIVGDLSPLIANPKVPSDMEDGGNWDPGPLVLDRLIYLLQDRKETLRFLSKELAKGEGDPIQGKAGERGEVQSFAVMDQEGVLEARSGKYQGIQPHLNPSLMGVGKDLFCLLPPRRISHRVVQITQSNPLQKVSPVLDEPVYRRFRPFGIGTQPEVEKRFNRVKGVEMETAHRDERAELSIPHLGKIEGFGDMGIEGVDEPIAQILEHLGKPELDPEEIPLDPHFVLLPAGDSKTSLRKLLADP
jgi:hypothetical protein